MRRMTIALGVVTLVAVAAGCSSKNNSSTPTGPSNTVTFNVNLLPSNETPPITNAENTARGTAVITVHKDTNVIDMVVTVTGFPAGSVLNNAHIHGPNAPTGVGPAGVFVGSGISAANFPALVNGTASFSASPTATADQVSQILANPSQFYFNVHTVANGGGVMRGQLQ